MTAQLARFIATAGGLGDRLPAPGTTAGSLLAVVAFVALSRSAPGALTLVAAVGAVALVPLAVWAAGAEAARRADDDPGAIVIDEVAGQWLALASLAVASGRPPSLAEAALCFALFRILDVVKPWPIRRLERLPAGWGIVADDLAAGLAAAAVEGLVLLVF